MEVNVKNYWYWLVSVSDMWFDKIRKLMEIFDNPKDVFFASEKELLQTGVLNIEDVAKIMASKEVNLDEKLKELEDKGIKFTCYGEVDYPDKLKKYEDKPYVLFYKGDLPKNNKSVAIIGSRSCSSYGREISENIAKELGKVGVDVISGMARGIDSYAHIGCIKGGGSTYAVLGSGVDVCYPRENIGLYTDIVTAGGVISEYLPGDEALAWHFPYRNRIISMLSDVILVVEAKEKSGTWITVDYALEYGKDVFAVPGRVTDVLSGGCNKLIKNGAFPYTEINDLMEHLGVKKNKKIIKNKFLLEKDFEVVYSLLCLYPVGVEEIVQKTDMDIGKVYEILIKLQIDGAIEEVYSGHYIKKL